VKLYDIDWARFLDYAKHLEELEPETRVILCQLKPQEPIDDGHFGADLEKLVKVKVLQPFAKPGRVRLHEEFRETSKALRAMARYPLWPDPTPSVLRNHLSANFTREERDLLIGEYDRYGYGSEWRMLSMLTSVAHLRGFMEAEDPTGWERDRVVAELPYRQQQSDTEPVLTGPHTAADTGTLLAALASQTRPVAFVELRKHLGRRAKARIGAAIYAAVRYALAFPTLDPETLSPALTLWPPVAERWNRTPTPWPEPVDPDSVVRTFDTPWGLEDVTQLLVAASEPLRLRSNDRALFAKAQREVEASLLALPDLMGGSEGDTEWLLETRVNDARNLALERELLTETGTSGKSLRLELTAEGRDWLARPPRERLELLLEPMRAPLDSDSEEEEDGNDLHWDFDPPTSTEFLPYSGPELGSSKDAARVVAESMRLLDRGHVLPRAHFVRHILEGHSPFRNPPEVEPLARRGYYGDTPTEEELEERWASALSRFLWERLMRFGGVRTGWTDEGLFTIELTDTGRWLLRLTDDLRYSGEASDDRPVRIQPDFEIVFLAPSPALEASIVRFAERLGSGVGTLFRITAASIHAAANAGLAREEVLSTLADASTTGIPRNVEHEIGVWFDECRRLSLEPALVVRCPDEDTAARIRSAAGRRVELVSPSTLLLDPAKRAEVIRLCRKSGIFLEGGEPDKPAKRKKKRPRRRRRYW